MSSEDESTSKIEAAVSHRLSNWSQGPKPPTPEGKFTRAAKRAGTAKKRQSAPDAPKTPIGGKGVSGGGASDYVNSFLDRVANDEVNAQASIVDRTLVRSVTERLCTVPPRSLPAVPTASHGLPLVVKAKDFANLGKRGATKRTRDSRDVPSVTRTDGGGMESGEFVDSFRREVGRFGSQALHRRDRKTFEAAELARLGCRPPKKQKIPIGLLITKRKKQKARAEKKQEMDLASGMLVRSKRR